MRSQSATASSSRRRSRTEQKTRGFARCDIHNSLHNRVVLCRVVTVGFRWQHGGEWPRRHEELGTGLES